MLFSRNLGFCEEISWTLIGNLIRLIVSSELCLTLEVIMEEPIRLWFGHFAPIPLVYWWLKVKVGGGVGLIVEHSMMYLLSGRRIARTGVVYHVFATFFF